MSRPSSPSRRSLRGFLAGLAIVAVAVVSLPVGVTATPSVVQRLFNGSYAVDGS